MKRTIVVVIALLLSLIVSAPSQAAESCAQLNVPTLGDDSLTVTMLSISTVEKPGSYQLTINYRMTNLTSDKKIDEGTFKLFFADGSSTPQYGFFGSFFPGDSRERSYTWEYLKALTPMNISYNAGFFSSQPSALKLNWAPPGFSCTLISPAAKAAAELKAKQEAEAKVAAELKAKQEAEAAKAAAELKAKQDAEAKVAAELKAKQAADAKAAADLKAKQEADAKAAADLKAKQEAEAKVNAELKALAELKAKQDAEANRKEQTISVLPLTSGQVQMNPSGISVKVSSTSNLSVFAYNSTNSVCEFLNGIIRTKIQGRCVIAFSQEGNSDYKPASNFVLDFTIVSAVTKKTTITCIKGKLTKKVTATNPKCPVGYKKK